MWQDKSKQVPKEKISLILFLLWLFTELSTCPKKHEDSDLYLDIAL